MIFQVILFFVVTITSTLYPMERHTYSASLLTSPESQNNQEPTTKKRMFFKVEHTDRTAPTTKVIEILQSIQNIRFPKPAQTNASVKKTLKKIKINLSEPLDALIVFKSGPPAIQEIKDARAAITQLAYVLELTTLLIDNDQLPELYTYLNDIKTTFRQVSVALSNMSADEIVAYYIADCYRPLVEDSVKHWFSSKVRLTLNQAVLEKITPDNDMTALQIIEALQKLSTIWGYYAQLFAPEKLETPVTLSHPNDTLSIQAWSDITYQNAEELYRKTKLGKQTAQEETAQRMAELAERQRVQQEREAQDKAEREHRIKAAADAKEFKRAKLEKELAEFNAYKDRVLQEIQASEQAALKGHADEATELMRSSTKKAKAMFLQEQATDLKVLKETTVITDPTIMLINDEIDAALAACDIISAENIAEVEKTVLASLVKAYEWLQEPREKYSSDDDDRPESYDDSYLHLKYKFNQQKLFPQLHFVLSKTIYAWNVYGYVRYAGKLESEVTLKFSAANKPTKSIIDWVDFTKKAGFSSSEQFEKLLKQKPGKSLRRKMFETYKWLIKKMSRKPTPKLSAEQAEELEAEMKDERRAIEEDEKAELEKIKRVMNTNEDRIKNPQIDPVVVTPSTPTAPSAKTSTEKAIVTKPKYADFDPDFATELRGMFAKQ